MNKNNNLKSIPNVISSFRILLIFPILLLIYYSEFRLALFLFLVAGISDALDGFLAKSLIGEQELALYWTLLLTNC